MLYRRRPGSVEVLLVHPGGPYFANKDAGAWSIPKGEYGEGEDPAAAALREFEEETGIRPEGRPHALGEIRQGGGKIVTAYALEGDLEADQIRSNSCEIEWPPRSGRLLSFPEVDRAGWFTPAEARTKILPAQSTLIDRLEAMLAGRSPGAAVP
jgi:predicted NUDIX family NTP pyrophosphohydrolase